MSDRKVAGGYDMIGESRLAWSGLVGEVGTISDGFQILQ
jgi:hypothetical protein